MPKRTGFLYEKVISVDNCIAAVKEMARGKSKNRRAMIMKENAIEYGNHISKMLSEGTWVPGPYKEHTIKDGVGKKERNIKAPCLIDQAVHHAIMRVTVPHIMRRNYYYNCGSIPRAGQKRATDAMKKWMKPGGTNKYCAQFDVKKFYDTCPHWSVIKALNKIVKDKKFLKLHETILNSMGDGLAIGFYPSQWYANLVLMWVDFDIKQKIYPECKYVRYMDDMCLLSNNKRKLHQTRIKLQEILSNWGLLMKENYKVHMVCNRFVKFLSYRFYHGYTLLRKILMYRIVSKVKSFNRNKSPHNSKSVMSYIGLIKHCNNWKFISSNISNKINLNKCRRLISYEDRNRGSFNASICCS